MRRRGRSGDGEPSPVDQLDAMFGPLPAAGSAPAGRRKARSAWTRFVLPLTGAAAVTGIAVAGLAAPALGGSAVAVREATVWFDELPSDDLPLDLPLPRRSVMYAADGKTVIAQLYDENRIPAKLSEIPQSVIDAVLAVEDDRYYERGPIDLRGTARAVVNNVRGKSTQGGSTLTQQYVKNLLLAAAQTPEEQAAATADSLDRKLREARYAVEAEKRLGKDGVLAAYLNTAYFGRGAYGIAAAAQRWFGIRLSQINVQQSAMLAAILKSPTNFDPLARPNRALARRDFVLQRMVATGRLDERSYLKAVNAPVNVKLTAAANGCASSRWPFWCQAVVDSLANEPALGRTPAARQAALDAGGLRIVTTLVPSKMAQAQRAVDRAFKPDNRVATSIAVVEPGTGHVVAIATNRRWGTGGKDRTEVIYATRRAFQSGSTFKPITLAAALSQGFSPYTKLDTPNGYVPAKLNYPKGGFNNDDRVGHGFLDAYAAMAESVNTYFVRVIERTGVKPAAAVARAMGMRSLPVTGRGAPGPVDAALTLGAFETSPLEVASVYATLASGGISCRPIFVTSLSRTSSKGELSQLPKPDAGCRRVLDPAVANTVVDVVTRTFGASGTARGLEIPGHETFGKTGTTNNSGATWFAGGSPQLTAAVWVGDPRGPRYSADGTVAYGKYVRTVFGRSIAGPIWKETLTALLAGKPNVRLPATDVPGLVALTPTVVPNVRGMTLAAALDALGGLGIKVNVAAKTAAPDRRFTENQVVSSDPRPGQLVVSGGSVTLTLSAGSQTKVRTQ